MRAVLMLIVALGAAGCVSGAPSGADGVQRGNVFLRFLRWRREDANEKELREKLYVCPGFFFPRRPCPILSALDLDTNSSRVQNWYARGQMRALDGARRTLGGTGFLHLGLRLPAACS